MTSRRDLLVGAAAMSAGLALGCRQSPPPEVPKVDPPGDGDEDVGPTEDLMREHGVLRRVLIVYDECARRLETATDPPPTVLPAAAHLVKTFVHGFHEEMEEDAIFPKCEHALVHLALVRALREQHTVGRRLTALIEQNAGTKERKRLAAMLRAFTRMYRAHTAREDTVLFPAYAGLLDASGRDAIGAKLAERERALFGRDGFARKVAEVAEMESALDLNDLSRVTPYDTK